MSEREEQQDSIVALSDDEFTLLQVMAYVFLQHRELDKAGIILKTLHYIAPENDDIRVSLAFVLSEFGHFAESEETLAPLISGEKTISSAARLLHAKLMLAQDRSGESESDYQKYLTDLKVVNE